MNHKYLIKVILNKSIYFTSKKTLFYFLPLITNISYTTTEKIILKLGLSKKLRIMDIKTNYFNNLLIFFENESFDTQTVRNSLSDNFKLQANLNTYKAKRRKLNYPVNGQRTRSNARTSRFHLV